MIAPDSSVRRCSTAVRSHPLPLAISYCCYHQLLVEFSNHPPLLFVPLLFSFCMSTVWSLPFPSPGLVFSPIEPPSNWSRRPVAAAAADTAANEPTIGFSSTLARPSNDEVLLPPSSLGPTSNRPARSNASSSSSSNNNNHHSPNHHYNSGMAASAGDVGHASHSPFSPPPQPSDASRHPLSVASFPCPPPPAEQSSVLSVVSASSLSSGSSLTAAERKRRRVEKHRVVDAVRRSREAKALSSLQDVLREEQLMQERMEQKRAKRMVAPRSRAQVLETAVSRLRAMRAMIAAAHEQQSAGQHTAASSASLSSPSSSSLSTSTSSWAGVIPSQPAASSSSSCESCVRYESIFRSAPDHALLFSRLHSSLSGRERRVLRLHRLQQLAGRGHRRRPLSLLAISPAARLRHHQHVLPQRR